MAIQEIITQKRRRPLTDATSLAVQPAPTKLSRKLKKPAAEPVSNIDPRVELKRLVDMHKDFTQSARSWEQSVSDRKFREGDRKGEVIPCKKPEHIRADMKNVAKNLQAEAKRLEGAMLVQLKQVPVYREFLESVYGFGPVASAYLVAMIRFEKCPNVSNIIRYCGNACGPNGKREIRDGAPKAIGGTGTFNAELRMRIWQAMMAMRKNASKRTHCEAHEEAIDGCKTCQATARPYGTETKYIRRWADAAYTRRTTGRALGADHAGRRKATDLFLWDLYVMGRTLEGLDIRADKYSAIRGRFHNGQEANEQRYSLTLDEAKEIVGDASGRPATAPIVWKDCEEVVDSE